MNDFYSRTYNYQGKIIGVCRFVYSKLFVIGTYDPKTGESRNFRPIFTDAEEGQKKLDEFAQEEGLEEIING